MNKFATGILSFLIGFFALMTTDVQAAKSIDVYVDGAKMNLKKEKPMLVNDSVLVPLRVVQEYLKSDVYYDAEKKKVTTTKTKNGQKTVVNYSVNSQYIFYQVKVNSSTKTSVAKMHTAPIIKDNRMYIPLRAATESLGYTTNWFEKQSKVTIKSNKSITPKNNKLTYDVYGDYKVIQNIDLDLFYLTNNERQKRGINPLAYDVENSRLARLKSKDMHDKKYFGHTSPTYGSPFDMLDKYSYKYKYAGENLAAGYSSAALTVAGWMESQGHKENILRKEFTRVGLGYYKGDNEYHTYYTQIFTSK